jgi:phosphoribosylanthranilate isomerase
VEFREFAVQFRIKICGITNVDDALAAIDAGADAIGLNFYRGSKRCIAADEARRVVEAIGDSVEVIGVFVHAPADEIHRIGASTPLRSVQLHGDEPPQFLATIESNLRVIRARRLNASGTHAIRADIMACQSAGRIPNAVLIDAATAGQFGGTGHTVDWQLLVNHDAWMCEVPLILAGGLTPTNVAEAIRIVRPQAVDVASGVESSPGKKDIAKVRDLVAAAKAAFAAC